MSTEQDVVDTFEQSLRELDVAYTRTRPDRFQSVLADVVEEPAVGVPLPFDGISLEDTSVELELTPHRLQDAETGVTPIRIAIAEYGSLVVQSSPDGTEPVSLYPPKHVAVVHEDDVLDDVSDATDWLGDEFDDGRNSAVLATGVSATGDMGAIVQGVHGPETVHVILLSD